jgi:hypothetical protein
MCLLNGSEVDIQERKILTKFENKNTVIETFKM